MRFDKGTFILAPNKDRIKGEKSYVQSVYFWLCDFMGDDFSCFPSLKRIADNAGCSKNSCVRAIERLTQIGVLKKENRYKDNEQLTNVYTIIIAPLPCEGTPLPCEGTPPLPCEGHGSHPTSFNSPNKLNDVFFEEYRKLYPNKKGKSKAMKLFTSKIKTNDNYKELVNGLQGYIKDHNELIAKGEFAPNYQQGDTFLSKETWKDYLGLVAQTQEEARQQAYEQNDLDIYKDFLKNEHGSEWIEKWGEDYSLLKKEINAKDFISQ